MPKVVLIIEDDADIAESVRYNLDAEGFKSIVSLTGEHGLALALDHENPPAAIILDLMLPGMNGMTAKTSEADRVTGLDIGADDYIAKPFSVRELMARVRAVLRRADEDVPERYDDGRLAIDFGDVRASCDGKKIKLTNKEFLLLSMLAKKRGRVINRTQLLDQVWGYSYYGDARTLDVHIRRLRQKLGDCGNCIETVVGVGYRFIGCAPESKAASSTDA